MTRDMVDIVVPGVRLCEADERHVAGPGTYAQHGYIYSSLLGQLRLVNTPNKAVSVEVKVFYSQIHCWGSGSACFWASRILIHWSEVWIWIYYSDIRIRGSGSAPICHGSSNSAQIQCCGSNVVLMHVRIRI